MSEPQAATVAELWRYPVKSMRGERVESTDVTAVGLAGDRGYAVIDPALGKVGSAKHPRLWGALLQCAARYLESPDGEGALPPVEITLPDGSTTRSDAPDVDDRLSQLFGRPVQLTCVAPAENKYLAVWPDIDGVLPDDFRAQNEVEGDEAEGTVTDLVEAIAAPGTFFDVSALHIVTTATLDRLGELAPESRFAVQRYRPNLVLDGAASPFSENGWGGSRLQLGEQVAGSVLIPTMRCIMTTLAQGDLPRDNGVLRTVAEHNRIEIPGLGVWSCVGAYATVDTAGPVRVGDPAGIGAAAN
jgi:uncharacterized protein YcbX